MAAHARAAERAVRGRGERWRTPLGLPRRERTWRAVACDRASVGEGERFDIEKRGGAYALRNVRDGTYCSDTFFGVRCDRDRPEEWELFVFERLAEEGDAEAAR